MDLSELFSTIGKAVGTRVQNQCQTYPQTSSSLLFFPSKENHHHLFFLLKKTTKPFHRGSRSQKEQLRKLKWARKSVLPYGTRHQRTGAHTHLSYSTVTPRRTAELQPKYVLQPPKRRQCTRAMCFILCSFNTPFCFQMAVTEDYKWYHMEMRSNPLSFVVLQTISTGALNPPPKYQKLHILQGIWLYLSHKDRTEMRNPLLTPMRMELHQVLKKHPTPVSRGHVNISG